MEQIIELQFNLSIVLLMLKSETPKENININQYCRVILLNICFLAKFMSENENAAEFFKSNTNFFNEETGEVALSRLSQSSHSKTAKDIVSVNKQLQFCGYISHTKEKNQKKSGHVKISNNHPHVLKTVEFFTEMIDKIKQGNYSYYEKLGSKQFKLTTIQPKKSSGTMFPILFYQTRHN